MLAFNKQVYLSCVGLLLLSWLFALNSLLIVPVWDEMGMLYNLKAYPDFLAVLRFIWFECRLYRPMANTLLAMEQWFLPVDVAWQFSRSCNALMVLLSFYLLLLAAQRQNASLQNNRVLICYWLAVFLSPAVLIVSTWFANIFDATCLLLIALGVFAWGRQYFYTAGLLFGLAWFCKEAAVFVIPLLLYLGVISGGFNRNIVKTVLIYSLMGALYWLLRSQIVILGSDADIHSMPFADLWTTFYGVLARFLFPSFSELPSVVGVILLIFIAFSVRKWAFFLLVTGLIGSATIAYLGCLSGMISPDVPLISPAIFDARLFYMPLALLMFALLVEGLVWPLALICLVFASSLPWQYQMYRDFQLAYQSYYQLAQLTPRGVVIYVDQASRVPVFEGVYGLKIGAFQPADYILNPQDGSLKVSQ